MWTTRDDDHYDPDHVVVWDTTVCPKMRDGFWYVDWRDTPNVSYRKILLTDFHRITEHSIEMPKRGVAKIVSQEIRRALWEAAKKD
jgi:hypothetical protein